ncbi:RNA-directed DNA polymerase, eukaryota [Tanacetum coccineum]
MNVRRAVEGDENSKFFHGIVNRKWASLAVKGVMINGEWVDEPNRVKEEFRNHFASRFNDPGPRSGFINHVFPNQLNADQVSELEKPISKEEIRLAVWGCGENKSPGPDGFTFEFFRKLWDVVGMDFCIAVEWFFEHAYFPVGCNSSFIALIPKALEPKVVLKSLGFDFFSHCKIRIGNGCNTSFWKDPWIGDSRLCLQFPRLYALENNKECTVAVKMSAPFTFSFRREVRGGIESSQLSQISELLGTQILSSIEDRWRWDLNGDGNFHVKDVRSKLDDSLLPKADTPTRWITTIPIKLNIFAWKVSLNRLPTRLNLVRRGVLVSPISCPICLAGLEDLDHLLFRCNMAAEVLRAVCKWWNLAWSPLDSYATWLSWFSSIRMLSQLKSVLEGVFYTSWWCMYDQLLFADSHSRQEVFLMR